MTILPATDEQIAANKAKAAAEWKAEQERREAERREAFKKRMAEAHDNWLAEVGEGKVFQPLKTCPLKNGKNLLDLNGNEGGENYCYGDCAWSITDPDDGSDKWRGHCGLLDMAPRKEG